MRTSGNRRILLLAAILSLFGHIALASIFIDKQDDAKIAGGAMVSIAVMGDASVDQVMAGELNPDHKIEHHEAKSDPTELTAETELKQVQDTNTKSATLDTKPKVEQLSEANASNEIKAHTTTPKELTAKVLKPAETPPVNSEPVEIKTASILAYSNNQNTLFETPEKQTLSEKLQELQHQTVEPLSSDDALHNIEKAIEHIEAQTPSDDIPLPQFRPLEEYKKPVQTAKLDPQPTSKKPITRSVKKKVEPKKAATGRKGKNQANVKKGSQASKNKQGKVGSKKRGQSKASGNANISNYKGKVRQKIFRRFNPKTRPAKRDAVVAFTIGRNGSANGVRLAISSGNAKLDRAALSAVKRASPFPSLPSGKSKLAFSVGLNAG
ncbi:MAG: TonB family protein [Lentilitoribacter sp.]